jgi:outer membrane protein OmpA-like peptidoglycan-associated protein
MRLRSALLAATILAVPVAVKAQPVNGLYVGAGAGVNLINDPYVRHSPGLGTKGFTQQWDPGFTGEASVGYGIGNGLRFELEGNYIDNNLHKSTGTPFPTRSGGTQENYGVFGNALFDFDVGLPWLFPYVGAGVGYEQTHWHNVKYYGNNAGVATSVTGNGYYNNLAYQAILGAAYPIPGVPGLSLTAEYRFVGVGINNEGFHGVKTFSPPAGGKATGNLDTTSDFNNSVMFGVRYAFGVAPPPPPAPAPAAPVATTPARTYLVFFDWDKSNLTDRARQIVKEAADASTHVSYTRIEVNGYTDLSGTAQYNQGLSVRRANAVMAELIKDGVPRASITARGFGETHPLVPTAQGVREPQNRRVEIIIR